MKKAFKIAYSVLFFAACAAPAAMMPFVGNTAEIEKKELTELPAFINENGINNDFSTQFESWFNDRIPMRPELLSAANLIKGEVLNTASSNVISSGGWLFYDSEKLDYMNTNAMTDAEITAAAVTLSLLEERVTSDGGKFTFVPAPNKASVYGEHMPLCYTRADENNLTRLSAKLTELGVTYTDLLGALTEAKKSSQVYHARDSHWNNLGAVIGYNEIMNTLGRPHKTYADASYTYEQIWRADLDKLLYPSGGYMDWQYTFDITYSLFRFTSPAGVRDTAQQLAIFMSDKEENDTNISTQNLNKAPNKSLYMVRDSFGRALLPFMIDNYATANFVRTNRPELTGSFKDKDFVYEIVERNLKNVIATAPYMFAPERTEMSIPETIPEGGSAEAVLSDEGYAFRLYGSLPEDAVSGDGRVYTVFDNGKETHIFEAFPIYESELLGKDGKNGFSMFIDKKSGLSGEYKLTVISGGKAFNAGSIQTGANG